MPMADLAYAAAGTRGHVETLRFAADLAAALGLRLRLVEIRAPMLAPDGGGVAPDLLVGAPARPAAAHDPPKSLDELAERADVRPDAVDVLFGDPVDHLVGLSISAGADVLVVPDTGESPGWAWLLGAAARNALKQLSCPTVLVPVSFASNPTETVRIVAGVRDDDAAIEVAAFAGRIAEALQATLDVVHADVAGNGSAATRELLTNCASQVPRGVDLEVGTLHAPPAVALSAMGGAEDGTLLVLGRPVRGLVGSAVLGSVVHDVLKETRVPVAVVPPCARSG